MINYAYCTQCKADLELVDGTPHCPQCDSFYWQTSSPCASVLPVKDGQVLVARRGVEPYKGSYDLIGGFLKNGEHSEAGAVREVKEETGLDVRIVKLLGIYMDKYGEDGEYTLNLQYIVEVVGGEMKPEDDVAELEWIAIEDLPIEVGFKNTEEALIDLKRWYEKKSL